MISKRIIYLYRGYPEKIKRLAKENKGGIYFRLNGGLVGIDLGIIDNSRRSEIVHEYALREFEFEQEKFDDIIQVLPSLGTRISNVEIRNSELIPELQGRLIESIANQDTTEICAVIEEYRELGRDVESIEFFSNNDRIKFTRLAELDLSSSSPDVNSILDDIPVGILAGFVRGGW